MAAHVTLTAVASRAGVSIATVSRVLNGLPASEATAKRVTDAVAELGYRPNEMARSLKVGRTMQIAIVVPDAANPVYAAMMGEIQRVVTEHGYRLLLSQSGGDADDIARTIDSFGPSLVDGLVVVPLRVTDAVRHAIVTARVAVVVVGTMPAGSTASSVRADSSAGVGLAVEHLVATGRRRLAFVNGPVDTTPGRARLSGFSAATARLAIEPDATRIATATDFTHTAALEAVRDLLDVDARAPRAERIDAIVAANDLMAIAALRECAIRGIAVPEQIAITGMDDTHLAELVTPSLTSVDLGGRERAARAASMLVAAIDGGEQTGGCSVTIEPRLVARESTANDRKAGR